MVDFQLQCHVLAYDFFVTFDLAQLKYVVKAVHIARHVEGYWAHVGDKILLYFLSLCQIIYFFIYLSSCSYAQKLITLPSLEKKKKW